VTFLARARKPYVSIYDRRRFMARRFIDGRAATDVTRPDRLTIRKAVLLAQPDAADISI
jgi:hypothetical protein